MYRVILSAKGNDKIRTIRQMRLALGLGLVEAKNLVEQAELPFVLLDGIDQETANRIKSILAEASAQVDIVQSDTPSPMIFYRPDCKSTQVMDTKSPIMRALMKFFNQGRS